MTSIYVAISQPTDLLTTFDLIIWRKMAEEVPQWWTGLAEELQTDIERTENDAPN